MQKLVKCLLATVVSAVAIVNNGTGAQAASVLDFSGNGTLSPLLTGPDPLGLSGKTFSFTGFIDQATTPTACPTGLPVTPAVCYAIPANQLTGQIGALPPITVTTPSTLGLIIPASGPDVLELQFSILTYSVTAILQLAPNSFNSTATQHPAPFTPSPQTLTAATSVPAPINGSSVEYCSGSCSSGTPTWLGITGSTSARTPQLTTMWTFTGSNGASPYGGLVFDRSGAVYGTTNTGGTSNLGVVFKLTPPVGGGSWTGAVLHSFSGADGANPYGGVILSQSGALYGTTSSGGAYNLGVVFQLNPPTVMGGAWTEAVVHSFAGGSDGANPQAPVIFDSHGALYGTTYAGGSSNLGTVFQVTPPGQAGAWTTTVLHSFIGSDGANPRATVIFDSTGALDGTTFKGGTSNTGTVFQLKPPAVTGGAWTESVLHSFAGSDGSNPLAPVVLDQYGALYGTTFNGGASSHGTVFQLTPPGSAGGAWTELLLHSFSGSDGSNPQAGVVFDKSGNLDGTTLKGGFLNYGTIFQLMPPAVPGAWIETVLHSFGGGDGSNPQASVVFDKSGILYSTAVHGGSGAHGTVFKMSQ